MIASREGRRGCRRVIGGCRQVRTRWSMACRRDSLVRLRD